MMYHVYSDYFSRLPWTQVDWSECPRTHVDYKGDTEFLKEDINDFVEHLIRDMSRKTQIDHSIVRDYIIKENSAFFNAKERLFSTTKWHFKDDSPEIIALKQLLVMPYLVAPVHRVEQIKSLFDSLSSHEKFEVLAYIGHYRVTVTKLSEKDE